MIIHLFDKRSGLNITDTSISILVDTFGNLTGITIVKYDFEDFHLSIGLSVPRYSNYKKYNITLNKDHEWHKFFLNIKKEALEIKNQQSSQDKIKKDSLLKKIFKP